MAKKLSEQGGHIELLQSSSDERKNNLEIIRRNLDEKTAAYVSVEYNKWLFIQGELVYECTSKYANYVLSLGFFHLNLLILFLFF